MQAAARAGKGGARAKRSECVNVCLGKGGGGWGRGGGGMPGEEFVAGWWWGWWGWW